MWSLIWNFQNLESNHTQNVQTLSTFHLGLLETDLCLFHIKIPTSPPCLAPNGHSPYTVLKDLDPLLVTMKSGYMD